MYAGKEIQYFAEIIAKAEGYGLREDLQKVPVPPPFLPPRPHTRGGMQPMWRGCFFVFLGA